MLSAGEASGDLHAAGLIEAIRRRHPDSKFCFLGGDEMARAAGRQPLVHYRDMAYMGFADVVRHLPQVRRNMELAIKLLRRVRPDALILVDYPSFNLRLGDAARKLGIPVYYYIAPKVWAWKKFRIRNIRNICRRVLSILPFEPRFFSENGYPWCTYVGNPSVEEIDRRLASAPSHSLFCRLHGLQEMPILALVPGSRVSEIKSNLPVMYEAAQVLESKYQIVVAAAPGIERGIYTDLVGSDVPVVENCTTELMAVATGALVTSGTASLEAALARVPQVVCYRHNASRITYAVMSRVLTIPYVSLPNLIANRRVVSELLLHKCTPVEVLRHLVYVLPGHPGYDVQQRGYNRVRRELGTKPAADTAAKIILGDLH